MIEPFLKAQLEPIARRRHLWSRTRDLTLCWAGVALVAGLFVMVYRSTGWLAAWVLPVVACGAAIAGVVIWQRHRRWAPDYRQIARQIEQQHPELHALLLTAVEQEPDPETGKLNFFQQRVVREAIEKSAASNWQDTVSTGQLGAMRLIHAAMVLAVLALLSGLRVQTKEAVALAKPTKISVTPGDTSIERGNGLAVLARFDGPLPPDVTLVIRPDSAPERQLPMMKSLNDPVFGGSLAEVTNALTYHVTYSGGRSPDFKVDVFEFPRLERADAHLSFPSYTGLAEKTIADTRRISAVEGSTLGLSLQLNKPVASARLVARDNAVLPLSAPADRASASLEKLPLQHSQTYELILVDTAGRTNKVPAQIIVDVLTNRAPELKFEAPRGDQRVSPLQEIGFQGNVWDDFGVKAYGISYTLAGNKPQTISLGSEVPGGEKRSFSYLMKLEDLGARPDQLISYFLWADDIGPDGQVRRTATDMFYAEVRPFEEIFREGQSSAQNEQEESQEGGGNEATKLAELQKQILNATWRLQRENRVGLSAEEPAPSTKASLPATKSTYTKDVGVVEQSQKGALKQATAHKSQSENPQLKTLWEAVEKAMGNAADQLGRSAKSPEPLPSAVESEQAAYQALLKLSAHEFQVAQNRRSRSQSSSQQSMQRELDQLDLKQSENRYESQSQAAAKQNPEQREQQQVLNRLKELAQRQQDLNERLKELQTALKEAKSEQEKEDIRRQLKRLREEEQQMLADVDDLMQRMQRPENQSRMADARQQLEQSRNQVQRTADAIDKESVSQALSSGTRAQRELQDLRDDFRKKNSAQFADEMRQMRSDARDLAQKQDQISEQLQSLADPKHKTLSDSGQTADLSKQLTQQSQKMTNLLEQMTRVSQESETAEPLLSKQLYDTLRKASQNNVDDSLKKTDDLLKLSFFNQAGQFEQRARKGIGEVKQGVERAAESVLGDETEALRLARNELDDLAKQVEKELAQNDPNAKGQPEDANSSQNQQSGRSQRGQQQGRQASANRQQGGQQGSANRQQPGQQQGDSQSAQAGQQNQDGQANSGEPNANQQPDNASGAQAGQQAQNQQGQRGQSGQRGQGGQPNQSGQQNAANQGNRGNQGQNGEQTASQDNQDQSDQAQANAQSDNAGQRGNQGNAQQAGAQPNGRQPGQPRQRASLSGQRGQMPNTPGNPGQAQAQQAAAQGGGANGRPGPITGDNYSEWSDRLGDVEELLDYPDLRNEVAGVRDRARQLRIDFKRSRKSPQASVVRSQIADPLLEVRNRINEELAKRESKDSLVPIDRDPVPQKYSELVRRYYEKLGREQDNATAPATRP
jgi:hypothetical protein